MSETQIVETGQKFGRLSVLQIATERNKHGKVMVDCVCDCGAQKTVSRSGLLEGSVKSCGCLHLETATNVNKKHGCYLSRTYRIWQAMKARCLNPSDKRYPDYGGRGISVCERWISFESFLADMGDVPEKCSIDRIDNDGNYEPGNCRWATSDVQARNRSDNHMIDFQGTRLCLTDWAAKAGLSVKLLATRLDRGWSVERALTTPQQKRTGAAK